MKDEYDFSKARKNPYASKLKKEAVADKPEIITEKSKNDAISSRKRT